MRTADAGGSAVGGHRVGRCRDVPAILGQQETDEQDGRGDSDDSTCRTHDPPSPSADTAKLAGQRGGVAKFVERGLNRFFARVTVCDEILETVFHVRAKLARDGVSLCAAQMQESTEQ